MFQNFFELPPQILSVISFLEPFLTPVWEILKYWWWALLPFILWKPFLFLWLWWRRDKFLRKQKFCLIDIKIPKEVLKPIRAMETVMVGLFQTIYDPPDSWEKWIEGKINLSYGFEIVSLGGDPHFFIRIPASIKDSIESIIYAQYPEAEISVADDYTKNVPQNIPNESWDIWGADYRLLKPDAYPIKTYKQFETEHEPLEEKRIDPLASLLEAMAKIGPGEQLWVQILAEPVTNLEFPWVTEGEKIRDELARRDKKSLARKPMIFEAVDVLITGEPPKEPEEKKETLPPEMKLTPGEREIISAVEEKIAKVAFKSNVRFIYLGKKDVFYKPKLRLVFGYFGSFGTQNLNYIAPYGHPLMTKVKKSWFLPINLFQERRLYMKKRKLFRNYLRRVGGFFPRQERLKAKKRATFILNIEEMATMFHFPGRTSAPAPFVERIEAKKGEAPPGLPTE